MDTVICITITLILTVFEDIEFSKMMLQGGEIEEAVIYFIFIFPIATALILFINFKMVKFIYDLIYYHTSFIPYKRYAYRDNSPKPKPINSAVVYRCDALLNLGEAIKKSNTKLSYDHTISECLINITRFRYIDSMQAKLYCNELESYLIECKPLLAQIPEGYMWLKSIGEIS